MTEEATEPKTKPRTPKSPLALALSRVPEDVRAAVESSRESGRWELAEEVLRKALRREGPGAIHADYARILLAIGSFELCQEALDKSRDGADQPEDQRNIEAELLVEQTAAQRWTPVPDRDGQAIPTTTAAVVAMADALQQARALEPSDPQTLRRLDLFQEVVAWASRSSFSGNVGAPLAASLFVLLGLIQWVRQRTLLGFEGNDILPLAGLYLASIALYLWLARTPQVALNRQVVAGTQSLDQRLMQTLLKAGPLVAVPVAAVRSVIYGSVIPLFVVHHCVRRRQPMISGLVLGACLATAHWYNTDRDQQTADTGEEAASEERGPGLDVLGQWLPLTGSIQTAVEAVPGMSAQGPTRWHTRIDGEAGGHSFVVEGDEQVQLTHVSLTVWGDGGDNQTARALAQHSIAATEGYWGPPESTQRQVSGSESCSTLLLLYGQPETGLRVRRQDCTDASRRLIWEAWPR